ncbi:MAG: glycosyltransferase [Patescibacteria group bacterium]
MKKVAVGIPTLNEEDTIALTTAIIDNGLASFFNDWQCFIVNADNCSQDGTKKKFLSAKTSCKKVYISSREGETGKGLNLINFFRFCRDNDIDCAATIDSDISTISKDWVEKLISPIANNRSDYITPLYARSRFEGSTTNHFAFPFIATFFGKNIRQPIGGEFSFNRKFIEYCLSKPIFSEATQYGIDIYMTTHALGGGFRVNEVFLGRKFHKPSFSKIVPMFKQVFASAIQTISCYGIDYAPKGVLSSEKNICIDNDNEFKHESKIKELTDLSQKLFANNESLYTNYGLSNCQLVMQKISSGSFVSMNDWGEILSDFFVLIRANKRHDPMVLAELIAPIFFLRTIAFWLEIKHEEPSAIELMLTNQAELIRSKTWEKLV